MTTLLSLFCLGLMLQLAQGHGKLTVPTDRTTQTNNGNKLTPFDDWETVSLDSCGKFLCCASEHRGFAYILISHMVLYMS